MSDGRRAFRLAYDGRGFAGFQRQPDVTTVEGALLDAFGALGLEGHPPPGYSAASRTDAGVSAIAQTVAVDAPEWCRPSALNAELPDCIWTWATADVGPDFHARRAATRRAYAYHLHAPAADDELARGAVDRLGGTNDYHNQTPDEDGTERTLELDLERSGDFLVITAAAAGFPRQLVRRLVSVIQSIATEAVPLDRIEQLLGPEPVDGPMGVPPAPATPLVLTAVDYDIAFTPDRSARATARERIETGRVEALTWTRVAATLDRGLER